MKFTNQTKALVALLAVVAALNAGAADGTSASPFLGQLSSVTPAELPSTAASLVAAAPDKTRSQATMDIVKAAVGLNPAAAGAIVGTIAQSAPDMAAVAAATAVSLVPDQAVTIARAAAAAAPKQAGAIVQAVCRVLPKSFAKVADAVAEVAPGADKEILSGLVAAIPTLKTPVNLAMQQAGGGAVSVSTVLQTVLASLTSGQIAGLADAPDMSGTPGIIPTGGAPYVPPSGSPGNLDPGSGGAVPTGGRGYATP